MRFLVNIYNIFFEHLNKIHIITMQLFLNFKKNNKIYFYIFTIFTRKKEF